MTKNSSRLFASHRPHRYPTRRRFLQFSAAALSSVAFSNCARNTIGKQPGDNTTQSNGATGDPKTLYLYAWADYMDQGAFKRFEQQTGIKIVADSYDSNETMIAKLQAGGGDQYSLIYPSDYMVRQLVEMGMLTPLDHSRIKGLDTLVEKWQNPTYDENNSYSVPYCWGTTGLLYNTDVVSPDPEDWNFLWEHADALSDKIVLLDDVRETLGAVLKSLGYSYNATDATQIEAAYNKLLELKPAIASFMSYGWEDQLIAGDLAICMAYSTLGNLLPQDHKNLAYVIPASGSSVWTDAIAIPNTAPNVDAAYQWINFMLQPENASAAVQALRIATPSKPGFELLPSELKDDTKLFPTPEQLAKCEGIAPVSDDVTELFDKYWTDIRST